MKVKNSLADGKPQVHEPGRRVVTGEYQGYGAPGCPLDTWGKDSFALAMAHQVLLTPVLSASRRTGRLRMGVRIVCRKAFKSSYSQQLSVGSHKSGERPDHVGGYLGRGKL